MGMQIRGNNGQVFVGVVFVGVGVVFVLVLVLVVLGICFIDRERGRRRRGGSSTMHHAASNLLTGQNPTARIELVVHCFVAIERVVQTDTCSTFVLFLQYFGRQFG